MRQKSMTFAGERDLRWEDLSAGTQSKVLKLLAELIEQAGKRNKTKEISDERQDQR